LYGQDNCIINAIILSLADLANRIPIVFVAVYTPTENAPHMYGRGSIPDRFRLAIP